MVAKLGLGCLTNKVFLSSYKKSLQHREALFHQMSVKRKVTVLATMRCPVEGSEGSVIVIL